MYSHMNKFKPFSILFYLEQLSAVVFGKQECRDMYTVICLPLRLAYFMQKILKWLVKKLSVRTIDAGKFGAISCAVLVR